MAHLLDFQQTEGLALWQDLSSLVPVQVDRETIWTEAKLFANLARM